MYVIPPHPGMFQALSSDGRLASITDVKMLSQQYEAVNEIFHSHFSVQLRANFVENARYHKDRYLDLLSKTFETRVVDVGNDKPFLSFFLKKFNPSAEFYTLSFEVPESPFELIAVDIESEPLPFPDGMFGVALFTEVIEHLWRNPAYPIAEINRVLHKDGTLFLTTPNPCERHALVCILWQANPNQRAQVFSHLESGHVHLWTCGDLRILLEAHGFTCDVIATKDYYGYSDISETFEEFIRSVSPYRDLMGESIVIEARKLTNHHHPSYPSEIFPDGKPVQFDGAVRQFALASITDALKKA